MPPKGQSHSEETRNKLRESNLKTWSNPELLKRHSELISKQYEEHPERRSNLSARLSKYYTDNPDASILIGIRSKERWEDPLFYNKMCEAFKIRSHDPQWIESHNSMVRRMANDPYWIEKVRYAAQNRPYNPINTARLKSIEHRENTSYRMNLLWQDPEYRLWQIDLARRRCEDPIFLKMMGESIKKSWESPERKARTSLFFREIERTREWCERIAISNSGENSHTWKGGVSFIPYCYKFNPRRRRAVRDFFNNRCICCGTHVSELRTNLHVHHIDHDKMQGCVGKPFNLVPLCDSDHSKEKFKEREFQEYIIKTLDEGFKWGIWSREQYEKEVMYPE
jgi:hypothetical protein